MRPDNIVFPVAHHDNLRFLRCCSQMVQRVGNHIAFADPDLLHIRPANQGKVGKQIKMLQNLNSKRFRLRGCHRQRKTGIL